MTVRTGSLLYGLFAAALIGASSAALACTPQAWMGFDKPFGPSGAPPRYPPGAQVTVYGHRFDPHAATPATLHWDGIDGPVVGSSPIDAQGRFTIRFGIPRGARLGVHYIAAEARDASGQMVNGLPARAALSVGAQGGAQRPAEAPASRLRQGRERRASRRPVASRNAAAQPGRLSVHANAAPAAHHTAAAPAVAQPAVTRAYAAAPALTSRVLKPLAAARSAARSPVVAAAPRGAAGPPWYALALAALGLLLIGGSGGAFVAVRRRPSAPLRSGEQGADALEAELQELLAEQRARDTGQTTPR